MKTQEIATFKAKGKANVYLEVFLHDNRVLETRWYGFTPNSVFAEGVDRIVEIFEEYKINSYLVDVTEHQGVGPDSQLYAAQKVSEYVQKHINKNEFSTFKQVVVLSNNIFSKVSVGGYQKKIEDNIETIITDDKESAYGEFDLLTHMTNS